MNEPTRRRLDAELVRRGLAASGARARALILAGKVRVGGVTVTKAGRAVTPDAPIELEPADHSYASRGGIKLAAALDHFRVDVGDKIALDIGASTGGFTDALLARGAARVIALDVGRGQLDWRLRSDPRVTVLERYNARTLAPADLPALVDLVTVDVSFISLTLILPRLPAVLRGENVIALVKPQFEVGKAQVGAGGIVRDPALHATAIGRVLEAAQACGLAPLGVMRSPIEGAEGNREFLVHLARRSHGLDAAALARAVADATQA